MEKTSQKGDLKRPIFETVYCAAAFLCFFVMHQVPLSLIKDSYGLFAGRREPESGSGWASLISAGYIRLVDGLYFYLGEKPAVIRGLHIVCGFLCFLLLFLAVRKFQKPPVTYGIPALVLVGYLGLGIGLDYDAWILPAFVLCIALYVLISLFSMLLGFGDRAKSQPSFESLAERQRRESQAPKTIINDKGETITLLANPLPGPKKHVKRVLDYDIDVPPELMCYDTPVALTDDYDIQ